MLFVVSRNTAIQDLAIDEAVNLGTTYRTYFKKYNGLKTFSNTGTAIAVNQSGVYKILVTAIVSAPVAGDVTLELQSNGVTIPGAIATETITTAATEFHTMTIQGYVLVNETCTLGIPSILAQSLTVVNTGVASTVTNIVISVTKEV